VKAGLMYDKYLISWYPLGTPENVATALRIVRKVVGSKEHFKRIFNNIKFGNNP
jgi:hypothetical protein